ncbi:DUF262 domain-containing protein [Ktedonobacteria bacterium brp13]|nr:DUF262 domain-containing protein [Ktedonobacteria bacterium brp13]
MSIGEWISLYENDEIDIHPEFQRFFRWDIWQKSRLIESILLGIPIPPIFVSQRTDGVWDVVDGLQRLATIFQFVGILKNENGDLEAPLVLEKTDDLPSLKDVVWDNDIQLQKQSRLPIQTSLIDSEKAYPKTFTQAQRLLVKRAKIQVSIILKESDEKSKYDLFQRLNTGGSSLSSQELRNCILVSINHEMYRWLRQLSEDENFMSCANLTDRAISEQYDLELVLRFIIFRNLDSAALKNIGDLDEFLTKKMRSIAISKDFDKEKESIYFKGTFEILAKNTGVDSFRKYDVSKNKFSGGFLVSAFEAVALGVGYNLDALYKQPIDIEDKIKQMWKTQEFTEGAGSGRSASARISRVIPIGRRLFGL